MITQVEVSSISIVGGQGHRVKKRSMDTMWKNTSQSLIVVKDILNNICTGLIHMKVKF